MRDLVEAIASSSWSAYSLLALLIVGSALIALTYLKTRKHDDKDSELRGLTFSIKEVIDRVEKKLDRHIEDHAKGEFDRK